jgi:tetratricopeptide (TPR) repeat protein
VAAREGTGVLTGWWALAAVVLWQATAESTDELDQRGRRALRQGRYDEALATFEEILAQDSRSAWANYRKGMALAGLLDYSGAVGAFERAVEIDPGFGAAWRQLVVLYPQIGRAADARDAFEQVRRLEDLPEGERLPLARALRKAGWIGEAEEALGSPGRPWRPEEHLELGLIASEEGEDARAAEHLEHALATPSTATAEAEYRYGLALEALGRSEEALAAYRRALERDPRHRSAHFRLGNLLLRTGEAEEGRALLRDYETLRQWDRRVNLLKFMVTSGKLSGDEEREKTHALVMLLLQGGVLDEAGRVIAAALAKHPEDSDLIVAQAWWLLASGERQSARKVLEPLLERKDAPSDALWLAARIDLAEGRLAEAVATFERSVAVDPDPPPRLLEELGTAYARAGRVSEAEAVLRRALEKAPDLFTAQQSLGDLLLGRGAFEEAEALLREGVRFHPGDPEVRRSLARALEGLGRGEEAALERKAADEIEAPRKRP